MASSTQLGFRHTLLLHQGRVALQAVPPGLASCAAGVRFCTEFAPVTLKCRGVRGETSAGEGVVKAAVMAENYGEITKGDFPRFDQVGACILWIMC